MQNKEVFFIKNAAKFLGYKQINIIYGWDQPTLKGCVAANKDEKIITTNKQLKLDLKQFHNFPNSNLINLGNFFLEDFLKKRKKFKSKKIVIFYALNTIRGAGNEIEVIKNIINFFVRQKIKYKLVLRPHPHDRYYFKEILKFKNSHIEIMKSTFFDINKLIEKLNESDLVLTNGTSMFLDARALNKQCASLILDKSDLNLQKPHLRFFSKKQHNLLLVDVETKAALRLQRRLVILLAKEPKAVYSTGKKSTRQATKNKNQPLIFKVLKEAKLMKMICQYID